MSDHRPGAVLLVIGSGVAVAGHLSAESLIPTAAWVGLAGSYLLAGLLHGALQFTTNSDDTPFAYGLAVALLSTSFLVYVRLSDVLAVRPDLGLVDAMFDLWQVAVLVPLTVAFMTPFGIAKGRRETSITALILALPYLAGTVHFVSTPGTFPPSFIIAYHGVLLLSGAIAGLPLYLCGRRLRGERPLP